MNTSSYLKITQILTHYFYVHQLLTVNILFINRHFQKNQMDNHQRQQAAETASKKVPKNALGKMPATGQPYMPQTQQQPQAQGKALKGPAKEISSKSQSPHTSSKFQYQQANLFANNSYSQSYLSKPQTGEVNKSGKGGQQLAEIQRTSNAFAYGSASGAGVMGGLQQAPSMPYLVQKAAHEAYSFAPQNVRPAGGRQHVQASAMGQKQATSAVGGKDQMRKQKKILGVFTNYGGAISSNSNEGPGSAGNAASAHRSLSNNGSINSEASRSALQRRQAAEYAQAQSRKKSSNKSQNSVKSQPNRINDNLYYPAATNIDLLNQNQRSAGNSHDSQKSNQSKVSAGVASLQSGKGKKLIKQTSSQKKQSKQSPGQDQHPLAAQFNNDYGMADNIGMGKGPGNVHHYSDKTKFAAYQAKIQVSNTKQSSRKTPKFLASSNMNLQNQASFGQRPNKQYVTKTRNHGSGQNRTMQAMVMGGTHEGLQSPRSREQQYFHGSGGYRVKSNKNSEEPRSSALTEQNKDMQLFQTDDPDSEKQHKLRMKKKLLMSDSLQMLTKQRNQYLHHSINKSIQSKGNSQKSNQSREPRAAGGGVSMTCVVGNDEQNDAMYGGLTDQQIQTITMHNSIHSSNNFHDTQQSSQQSSVTGSFNQPAPADYRHQASHGSRKELSFRYKEPDGRIEHIYSGEYTEPEIIEGFGGDECISSRRQTKHSPSFPQSIVTSANAGQTIVHSLNSQENMSSTGTLMKNASGSAAALGNNRHDSQGKAAPTMLGQNVTKALQQKAINVKKAMVKVSQGFKDKFARAGNEESVGRAQSNGKQMIDKADFAQKLQKVQDDIRLRNQIQDQRELELNRLQQDFQDQITDAKSKTSAQQSIMESSSRELTFQLKELERLQQQSQFENELPPPSLSFKNNINENLKLNLKLNSHREGTDRNGGRKLNDIQSSGRFQNMPVNPNSDRFNHRQLEMQNQRNFMSQNLIETEQAQQLGGQSKFTEDNATPFNAAGYAERAEGAAQASGIKSTQDHITKVEEVEEGCTGHDSRRAQQRMSHTPQAADHLRSQIDTSEQNYGHEISQTSQMTPTVGQFQPTGVSNQKTVAQPEHVPPNIKMRPLNLNQFQHSQAGQLGDKYRRQFNFHAQLSSSRLSLKGETINGAKISERDAETERKGKLPSSRSSLMASQNIQITNRSKLDRVLNVKVTKKVEDRKPKQLADTGGLKHQVGHSMNQEGTVQIANFNQVSTHNANTPYGSGSKRGLNSRNLNYSDLKSPPRGGASHPNKHGASNQKYDEQIYMTIGQADPHPSQQTQIEMSASHLEQSNTSHASNPGMNQTFHSVDQRGQKKKFSTISHEQEGMLGVQKNQINTMGQNSRIQKKIRINELPVSPRHKGLPHVSSGNGGLRLVKNRSGQKIYLNTIQHHQAQVAQKKAEAIAGSADDGQSQHQVYENQKEGQSPQNLKLYRQQESRSLENNERPLEIILSEKPQLPSEQQNPSSAGCDLTNSRILQKQKANKKAQQNTLEMQMTGKGQYKLVKVKNRSQDPHSRKQDHAHGQEDYKMVQESSQIYPPNQKINEVDASPDFQKEYSTLQQTPQINPQYNSRRNAAVDSSHKNFKVMVVRSSDGQRKQISGPLAKFGATNAGKINVYESNNEYTHQSQKMPARSQSSNKEQQHANNQRNNLVAGDPQANANNNNSCNGSSLSDNYANAAAQGKRANSTQSEQLKRSKINASQLFDNSFLCCLTQTKQKKENIIRQYR